MLFDIIITLQACNSEEDGLFGFDLHSNGDGQRYVLLILLEKKKRSLLPVSYVIKHLLSLHVGI